MQNGLHKASVWIIRKWLGGIIRCVDRVDAPTDLAEFGAFEANLAEVTVVDHGADFVVSRWGAEIGMLCGGISETGAYQSCHSRAAVSCGGSA